MRHKRFSALVVMVSVALLGVAFAYANANAGAGVAPAAAARVRPVVFVHGFVGSGAQFETQALRFESNGYPAKSVAVHEYDSTFSTETQADVFTRLDRRIKQLLETTGSDKIDLLGHSLGTTLMQSYLTSDAKRAAKVAHYVNIDGAPAASPPGGVPTLAIWGEGSPARKIVGAANVYFTNQSHVQVATSPETFEQIYTFFTGRVPATTDVVPEPGGRVQLEGRAMNFPQNTGCGGKLQIFEVSGTTGARLHARPEATFRLNGDGSWGPFAARADRHYEFAIVRDGAATHHLYYQPFTRSDHWIRLLTSPPTGGIGDFVERSDHHASLTIVRYKEWWADQSFNNDELDINGVSILNAANSPRSKRVNGIFVYDAGVDGVSHLATPIPTFFALPFLTGVDDFIPGVSPANDTISITSITRGGRGHAEVINVPNWASATDVISVQFRDDLER
jgi:pimeloyl-ACP methyl ester carboxylesterase